MGCFNDTLILEAIDINYSGIALFVILSNQKEELKPYLLQERHLLVNPNVKSIKDFTDNDKIA
ncbi:MAG: hypothetical protein LBF13_01050 [Campylobacteraceae bacterium]|jgi:hypothetical protein|nr:hypothetical protein [Campylobacteraceae bacterium]